MEQEKTLTSCIWDIKIDHLGLLDFLEIEINRFIS